MFEALDVVRSEVERRFDQEGLRIAAGREQAVLEAAQGKRVDVGSPELSPFSREQLSIELHIQRDVSPNPLHAVGGGEAHKALSSPAHIVAASERSFSALRRLKTWLRNTMKQERLTHLAIMNAPSDLLDECDVSALLEEFISRSTEKRSTLGKV
ncbi:Zinc finger MYM-type protein 1 [Caligus rogercresseyi]|uniref:Zinc finger MYM-type protein 1 n=1 Tax=Caligus rogercresseyi TaxID=217165 RepID=A0A7T8K0K7_CALRO|nr:Zinc finger MYM-type protein 1 [Caligus rogercresseyi]